MLNRNAKTLKVYSARITTSKQLYFANLLRISIKEVAGLVPVTSFLMFSTDERI